VAEENESVEVATEKQGESTRTLGALIQDRPLTALVISFVIGAIVAGRLIKFKNVKARALHER
jgi:hypothetical protein